VDNSTTSGLRSFTSDQPWYCGRVPPGRERAFERGLHRFDIPTYLPVHKRSLTRNQYDYTAPDRNRVQTYTREMPLFPGYVFVSLADGAWMLIRERQSYRPSWLAFNGKPAQIPIEVIEDVQSREVNGFVRLDSDFSAGDELEITDGVWAGRKGLLASDPDRRILTLHLIAESYALQPTQVMTKLKIDREQVRLAL